jgi:hypothetical protein
MFQVRNNAFKRVFPMCPNNKLIHKVGLGFGMGFELEISLSFTIDNYS